METRSLCDVCQSEPMSGCAASAIGPFSLAYGLHCIGQNAEPLWAFHALFGTESNDELKQIIRDHGLSSAASALTTYVDGVYVDILEWSAT